MKKIYINNTARVIVFGKTALLPGSNMAEEIDGKVYPQFAALVDGGEIEITDNAVKAVEKANTQKAVEEIVKASPKNEKVKAAAKKRKERLDTIDAQAKAETERKLEA